MLRKKATATKPATTVTTGGTVTWKMQDRSGATRTVTLKCQTARELLAENIPQRGFLLAPWLREQESVLLYSPTGGGKSLFALSAAIAVAGGGKMFGWTAGKRASNEKVSAAAGDDGWRVLFIDGEMHEEDIQERLRGLLAGADHTDREKVLSNITVISRQAQDGGAWFPSITEPSGVAFYCALVRAYNADMIVFDNFSTLGEVEDENAASSFGPLTDTLLALKQQGVATMLVHHAGKNNEIRGSTRIQATFEVIVKLDVRDKWRPPTPWRVEKADEDDDGRGAAFLVRFEKMRRGEKPAEVYASLKSTPLSAGGSSLKWRYQSQGNPRLHEIREGLEEARWGSQQDIADDLGVDKGTISRDLKAGYRFDMWTKHWITLRLATGLRQAGERINGWDTVESFGGDMDAELATLEDAPLEGLS